MFSHKEFHCLQMLIKLKRFLVVQNLKISESSMFIFLKLFD